MKNFICMQFLLLIVSISHTDIITKTFKLSENQIINIEKGTINSVLRDSTENYLCNSNDRSGVDLIFRLLGNWDNFQCGCGGSVYGMLSKNPIYSIKTTNSSYFKNQLDIVDTATISLVNIESTFSKICPTRLIICPTFQNPCPGYENPSLRCDTSWKPPKKYWTLGTTTAGNKYLIRFDSLYMVFDSSQQFWKDYSLATFILQTDGTCNFSEAFKSPIMKQNSQSVKPKIVCTTFKKLLANDIVFKYNYIYDIQGKRINNTKLYMSNNKISGLMIISERNHSR